MSKSGDRAELEWLLAGFKGAVCHEISVL